MKNADNRKRILLFFLIFLVAIVLDITDGIVKNGKIQRNDSIDGEKEVELILNADGLPKDYVYKINVQEVLYTKEEAEAFFEEARKEIDNDFENVSDVIPAKEYYISECVEVEWSFSPREYIQADYRIHQEELQEDLVVNASATLYCGQYEEVYTFPFLISKKEQTNEEKLITSLEVWFTEEMKKEGTSELVLPKELDGVSLVWSERPSNLCWKVLFFEIVVFLLLYLRKKEQKKEEKKLLLKSFEQDYAELVGSLSVLMGAGMSLKQAWNVIATQYVRKKETDAYPKKEALEEVVLANRKMQEGESERGAFLQMMERIPLMSYHRLIHMLLANRDKGTKGLCEILDKEAQTAYEQKILNVRKMGEEASAKLLVPMMLMLVIVMAIVLLPAFINFSI